MSQDEALVKDTPAEITTPGFGSSLEDLKPETNQVEEEKKSSQEGE